MYSVYCLWLSSHEFLGAEFHCCCAYSGPYVDTRAATFACSKCEIADCLDVSTTSTSSLGFELNHILVWSLVAAWLPTHRFRFTTKRPCRNANKEQDLGSVCVRVYKLNNLLRYLVCVVCDTVLCYLWTWAV
jgi:hypothetical protein